jgi:hypothetical protein
MRSADVFQGQGRLERLLLHDTTDRGDDAIAPAGRRLAALFAGVEAELDEVRERLAAVEARIEALGRRGFEHAEPEPAPEECEYLLYLSSPGGHHLTSESGRLPAGGERIGDETATVLRVGRSPFPGDLRPCVFALSA